jgi:hypothetical protein
LAGSLLATASFWTGGGATIAGAGVAAAAVLAVRGAGDGRHADDRHRGDRRGDPAVTLDGALAALALQSFVEGAVAVEGLIGRTLRPILFGFAVAEVEGRHTVLPGSPLHGRYNPSLFT